MLLSFVCKHFIGQGAANREIEREKSGKVQHFHKKRNYQPCFRRKKECYADFYQRLAVELYWLVLTAPVPISIVTVRHFFLDINNCKPNPCQKDGLCVNKAFDYACECPKQYGGKSCEIGKSSAWVSYARAMIANLAEFCSNRLKPWHRSRHNKDW